MKINTVRSWVRAVLERSGHPNVLALATHIGSPEALLQNNGGNQVKLEFGDLWKFVVSAGFGLIGVELLFVWFLLKEPFDLNVKSSDLAALTPVAQETVRIRQQAVRDLLHWAPLLTVLALLFGTGISVFGFIKWRVAQRHHDAILRNAAEQAQNAVRPSTEDELANKSSQDAFDIPLTTEFGTPAVALRKATPATRSRHAEDIFESRLKLALPPTYCLERDMAISRVTVDFLLTSNALLEKDFLVELKYIYRGFNVGWLAQGALQVQRARLDYEASRNRSPNTAVVVVVEDDVWRARYENISDEVSSRVTMRRGKDKILVVRFSELETLDKDWFSRKLGVPIAG
ncbi:hypothetical protein KR767_09980 [Luteibacter anthropi]|uniref:hypothetical protein n=1 Tax=Luteibacter anthropi TaxID=564369 RepID=UPI0020326E12|nr:hypothetical protein [Luteibacter anthropi]URX64343.1 hypothetical protein KR767_09980 [Luteibacter anthropi]